MLVEAMHRMIQWRLFNRDGSPRSGWQVVAWWEVRRVPYNLIVGAVGIITSILCLFTATVCEHFIGEPIGLPDPPFLAILAVIAYGAMANVCFTGGWIAELLVAKVWPEKGKAFGNISFCLGLLFSVVLTLLPGILIAGVGAMNLLVHVLRH